MIIFYAPANENKRFRENQQTKHPLRKRYFENKHNKASDPTESAHRASFDSSRQLSKAIAKQKQNRATLTHTFFVLTTTQNKAKTKHTHIHSQADQIFVVVVFHRNCHIFWGRNVTRVEKCQTLTGGVRSGVNIVVFFDEMMKRGKLGAELKTGS